MGGEGKGAGTCAYSVLAEQNKKIRKKKTGVGGKKGVTKRSAALLFEEAHGSESENGEPLKRVRTKCNARDCGRSGIRSKGNFHFGDKEGPVQRKKGKQSMDQRKNEPMLRIPKR